MGLGETTEAICCALNYRRSSENGKMTDVNNLER